VTTKNFFTVFLTSLPAELQLYRQQLYSVNDSVENIAPEDASAWHAL